MAMGKQKRDRRPSMWVATTDFPTATSHPFYTRLNRLLCEHGFDDFAEAQSATFYTETMGRPSLPPGIYFRLLFIGYFEGIDSERDIAWRAADSFALRDFLGVGLEAAPPDHSTISRTRRLIAFETHRALFTWVLQCLSTAGLVKGKTIGIESTTLEANLSVRFQHVQSAYATQTLVSVPNLSLLRGVEGAIRIEPNAYIDGHVLAPPLVVFLERTAARAPAAWLLLVIRVHNPLRQSARVELELRIASRVLGEHDHSLDVEEPDFDLDFLPEANRGDNTAVVSSRALRNRAAASPRGSKSVNSW